MNKKWNIGWGVTSRCNMACAFCYSKERRMGGNDIPLEVCLRFVDQNASSISTINYGTGENSLSDDWFHLIKYIRETYPEIRQALTTNGYISEAISQNENYQKIFLSAIDEVDVSLDFSSAEAHNCFRGQTRAWEWAINTLSFCRDVGKHLSIVTLGSAPTLQEENMRGIFEIAGRFNAVVRVNIYRPVVNIYRSSDDAIQDERVSKYILPLEQLLSFIEMAQRDYRILAIDDPVLSSLLTGKTVDDPSGIFSLRILPRGEITPSTYLIGEDFVLGNLGEGISLEELEKNTVLQDKIRRVLPLECNNCPYAKTCGGGVLDRRYLWYGTLNRRDPYCFFGLHNFMERYANTITVEKTSTVSVHDGYLPTLFFKNKEEDK